MLELEKDELLGKVVLLQGSNGLPEELRHLPVPIMQADTLFMPQPPAYVHRRPGSIPLAGLNQNITTQGGLISPQSETHITAASTSAPTAVIARPGPTVNGTKPIDPMKASQLCVSFLSCGQAHVPSLSLYTNVRVSHTNHMAPTHVA